MNQRSRKHHRKKYRIKPRFFIIVVTMICIVAGGGIFFSLQGSNEANEAAKAQIDQGNRIMMAAKKYISNDQLHYDPAYFSGGYPTDNIGVCTDVIWQGLQGINVTLKDMLDEDTEKHPEAYQQAREIRDPNIDFRSVPTLEIFLQRNTQVLTNNVGNLLAWMPGDIVSFESSHVAIVSNLRNIWGMPFIIQHGKDPAGDEDRIFASDGMKISGHFRWPVIT